MASSSGSPSPTNGLLLDDDKIDFINREMSNVVLSIDGRREVNDRVRVARRRAAAATTASCPSSRSSSKSAGRHYDSTTSRGTFTKYNKDFAEDVLHLSDMGFDQVSVEPVVTDPAEPYALTE